jgi:hypothetical protein
MQLVPLQLGDRSQDLTVASLRAAITMADVMKYAMSGVGGGGNDWMEPDLARKFDKVDWNDPESAVAGLVTFHHVILQSKTSVVDSRHGPCNQSNVTGSECNPARRSC